MPDFEPTISESQTTPSVSGKETPPNRRMSEADYVGREEFKEFKSTFYWLLGAIIFFIIINIILLGWDLNKHDGINSRIDNLQSMIMNYEENNSQKLEIIDCLKYSKYWEYNKCFNN